MRLYSRDWTFGKPMVRAYVLNGDFHGEYQYYARSGIMIRNTYYMHGKEIHNFIENPLTDIAKMILVLKYGAPALSNNDVRGIK